MRLLALIIISLLLAAGIGNYAEHDAGQMIITISGWTIQTSFSFFIILIVVIFLLLHFLLRLLSRFWNMPSQLGSWKKDRGAKVDYAEVYSRDCPEYERDVIDELWSSNSPDVVIVTSNNGLENLFSLLDKGQRNFLLSKQLIVMGERMLDLSIDLGFTRPPIVAEENSDEGILKAIVKWAASK